MQKAVLVTGASSGIGLDTVRALVNHAFFVIATVRKSEDEIRLNNLFGGKVKVIKIDLANLTEIEKLPEILKQDFDITVLHGLVIMRELRWRHPFNCRIFLKYRV